MKKTSRAGVSDTRAGLQPAGLFSNAGIFKKGFQDFHPLDESPYLLFDAESSMLGNLENPSLDLDASKAETLDVITATRAGIATFTAADGQIVTADPDTVRVDWSLGYPAMLIEPSATNDIEYSEDFSHSSWSKFDVSISAAPVDAPDGTTNATHVVATGSNAHLVRLGLPSGTNTISIWARTVSGSGTCYLTAGGLGGPLINVTEEWQRFEVPANTHAYAVDFRNAATLDEIYIWGAQVEAGSVATSYIPTSGGSVAERTRNADNLVIDGTAFSDFYNATEGTFFVSAQLKNPNESQAVIRGGSNSQLYIYSNSGGSQFYAYDGSDTPSYGFVVANELSNFALSYTASTYSISKDGNGPTSPSSASGNIGNATLLQIGTGYSTMNGHIKRLIYWPTHSSSL